MQVAVSMDKVVLEFDGVRYLEFMPWYIGIATMYRTKHIRYKKKYCNQMNVKLDDGAYMHVFYKNFRDVSSCKGYTLRIETNPAYYHQLQGLLLPMWEAAAQVYFISSDVAFDVPQPISNVIVIANHARRKLIQPKGMDTRYFGKPHQRKTHAYCRIYDKYRELLTRGIDIGHELTRIEMVHKPEQKILLSQLAAHPPEFNPYYYASILTNPDALTAKERERAYKIQTGAENYTQHVRKTIKKSLASQFELNFNQLASEYWADLLQEHKLIA